MPSSDFFCAVLDDTNHPDEAVVVHPRTTWARHVERTRLIRGAPAHACGADGQLQPGPLLSTVYQFTERLRAHSIRPVHVDLKALSTPPVAQPTTTFAGNSGRSTWSAVSCFTKEYDHARDFQIVEILEDAFRTEV
ncbi:uncharacterized protein EHS24_006726 [Apiotrichum porosum]|uniref:Uncharacterized protein n=1 Tax=Apiotrichum porosum TaxID=105984 RepID=A0A427XC79_9TREE|nr:uncharacterized protein EHS24_006726 [Apiotrichum porosum]RSH76501.1 hypothetical protein EHS24_006726 [Apiotrichum porosum]